MPSNDYSDRECVAALNACVDLNKFAGLPGAVQNRVKKLLEKNRIKMVCFFTAEGFGLRVYSDARELSIVTDNDEATVMPLAGYFGQVDEDGAWVRCPKSVWETRASTKIYAIMSKNGRKFYDGDTLDEEGAGPNPWSGVRSRAVKYTNLAEVTAKAAEVGGIVIEHE